MESEGLRIIVTVGKLRYEVKNPSRLAENLLKCMK
jgi:hypothetical protein